MVAQLVELPIQERAEPDNVARVPQKQWRRWSPNARVVFNAVYTATSDQDIIKHPKAPTLADDQWLTIRWNVAWLAADAADGRL